MSGHSKWAQIKRKKAVTDARKGQMFTRLAREIALAAREGGADPAANFTLRLIIDKARTANMPKENIERAIQRGTGALKGEAIEEITYEGYGPGGIALLVQVMTDNRNRAIADIRRVFNRQGGNLGESGSVGWMFDQKGVITVEARGMDPDELGLLALDAGAEDARVDDSFVEIYTEPKDLHIVREALARRRIPIETAEINMVPKSRVQPSDDETLKAMRLIEALEELDDVQRVYSNLEIPESLVDKLEAAA